MSNAEGMTIVTPGVTREKPATKAPTKKSKKGAKLKEEAANAAVQTEVETSEQAQVKSYEERDKQILKIAAKNRASYQKMRIALGNRLGIKANGEEQDVSPREFTPEDAMFLQYMYEDSKKKEDDLEKFLKKVLKRFPVYTQWLKEVKGVGTIGAAWLISEIDIYKASNVSKIWQFAGLNPNLVPGKKWVRDAQNRPKEIEITNTMIRGDRLTGGFIAPYNQDLKRQVVGVMANDFLRSQSDYALNFYYPTVHRLENSDRKINEESLPKDKRKNETWAETSKGRRAITAKRKMMKEFLKDFYVAWREIEGLPVRAPYKEEYLGRVHGES